MGIEDRFFFDGFTLAGLQQRAVDIRADLFQGGVQRLQLLIGAVLAGVRRQGDGGQAYQRATDQAGRGAHAQENTVFARLLRGRVERRWRRMACIFQRRTQHIQQGQQCGFAVRALATDLHFLLFADAEAHDADQAVEGGGFIAQMQARAAMEALRGLAQQGCRACMQAAVMGDPGAAADFVGVRHRGGSMLLGVLARHDP